MKRTAVLTATALTVLAFASPRAADIPPSVANAAKCAPHIPTESAPPDGPRIIGVQDPAPRALYGERDLLIVGSGNSHGLAIGQRFYIRRLVEFGDRHMKGPRVVSTAGWLRIVAANETTSIATIEFACEAIERGDYLEPLADFLLPDGLETTDATGEPDFTAPAHVLFGDRERLSGGAGDFMMIDAGTNRGAEFGARLAVYRDLRVPGLPLTPIGEAIVVQATADNAVIRLTTTRDAVQRGDLVVPRRKR